MTALERRFANPGTETTADALLAGRFANPGSETTADARLAGRLAKWLGIYRGSQPRRSRRLKPKAPIRTPPICEREGGAKTRADLERGTGNAMELGMLTQNRGVWPAWLWMFILALLLGWLPFIGPAIAGFVGGLQAGEVGSALVAAIIPSIIVAGVVFLLGTVLALPIIGALMGAGIFMVLLIGTVPLLLGAWIGGAVAERRGTPRAAV